MQTDCLERSGLKYKRVLHFIKDSSSNLATSDIFNKNTHAAADDGSVVNDGIDDGIDDEICTANFAL